MVGLNDILRQSYNRLLLPGNHLSRGARTVNWRQVLKYSTQMLELDRKQYIGLRLDIPITGEVFIDAGGEQ